MKSCCKSLVELALHSRGLRLSQEMDMGVERRAFVDIICTAIATGARMEYGSRARVVSVVDTVKEHGDHGNDQQMQTDSCRQSGS